MNSPKDYLTDREKLMEKIREILVGKSPAGYRLFFMKHGLSMSEADEMINGTVEQLLTLLTSEVEKQKDDMLNKIECLVGYLEYFQNKRSGLEKASDEIGAVIEEANEYTKEQRKALSDIGGGK